LRETKNKEEQWLYGQVASGSLAKSSDLAIVIGNPWNELTVGFYMIFAIE
jgi:hypothetical protein